MRFAPGVWREAVFVRRLRAERCASGGVRRGFYAKVVLAYVSAPFWQPEKNNYPSYFVQQDEQFGKTLSSWYIEVQDRVRYA